MFGLFGGNDTKKMMKKITASINAAANQAIAEMDTYITKGIDAATAAGAESDALAKPFAQTATDTMNEIRSFLGMAGPDGQAGLTQEQVQSKLEGTPGYQFQFDQGMKAMERTQAAKGLLGSGRALTEATTFGQGLASTYYNSHMDRLAGLLGQTAPVVQQQMVNKQNLGNAILGARTQQGVYASNVRMGAGTAIAQSQYGAGMLNSQQSNDMMSGLGGLAGNLLGGFL